MITRPLAMVKPFALSLFALAFIVLSQGAARADEVHISGSTAGCFGAGCTPGASATVGALIYSNSTFSGTSAGGFLGIGANANPGSNVDNLGSLTVAPSLMNYTGQSFTLQVTFTAPQGINGSNQAIFTATLTGTVSGTQQGGIFIDFDNATPLLFTFTDPNCEPDPTGGVPGQQTTCGTGSFFFSVNDVSILGAGTVPLTGQITGAQQTTVPEPATMVLLGTGLTGIAAAARRRRNRKSQN